MKKKTDGYEIVWNIDFVNKFLTQSKILALFFVFEALRMKKSLKMSTEQKKPPIDQIKKKVIAY